VMPSPADRVSREEIEAPDMVGAAARLACELSKRATVWPGGTEQRGFSLPSTERFYCVTSFQGERIYAGGDSIAIARRELAHKLLKVAGA